ncbi:MAG: sugar-binding domain-containing protein [Actinomycetaceae bacterium]|nr:sugar-binding domain-containing protein [Actinomycetaceae bacterium]
MDSLRDQQMLQAAQLYYYEQLTQAAIAERMDCTRWTVGRLLDEARSSGMVTITINHPHARVRMIETELMERFDLREAIVLPFQGGESLTSALVASAAAVHITHIRPRITSIGVAWGRTMTAVAREMPEGWTTGLQVFQTYGGLVRTNDDTVADSIGMMARRGEGVGHMIPAPAIVAEVPLGRWLKREPSVFQTLEAATKADLLVFSPGVLEPNSVLVRSGFLTANGMAKLSAMGAVTDLFSHFVDAYGQVVSKELEARTIAISLDSVKRAKARMVVASGEAKILPLKVVLAGGYANIVVTDEVTARAVLDSTDESSQKERSIQ